MSNLFTQRTLYVHREKEDSGEESDTYDPKSIIRVARRRQTSKSDKKCKGSKTRIRMSGQSSCIRGLGPLPTQN
jgi:hypothetical protein